MIGTPCPVLASAGSDGNLGGALSTVVPIVAERPSATPRHPWSTLLDQRETARRKVSDRLPDRKTPQKLIQYPETRPGSVQ
jgi:hypothetical protein